LLLSVKVFKLLSIETTAVPYKDRIVKVNEKIQISILVDNNAKPDLKKEHGFSVWIEVSDHIILFDTGQSKALIHNSAALGCDLSLAEALILSHGHYDHTGGISYVLKHNPDIKIYCHSHVVHTRYVIRDGTGPKDISIPQMAKSAILGLPTEQVCWIAHPEKIHPNIGLSGPIPQSHLLENTSGPFYLDPEGTRPDTLEDDMALWIQSDRGLVIITGCCHSGLINTVNHVRRVSGQKKISAIIGGFHLAHASHLRLEATCQALQEWNVDTIIPCHCTGDEAVALMQNKLGGKVVQGYAGLVFEQ
jgi:7,8-dihydropterin-6-yl-methyl-4-(beta-D-ribofuranosyl)aminobenzene 5'-phosphate synthase